MEVFSAAADDIAFLDTLADFPAARTGDALAFLFSTLHRFVRAEYVFWNLIVRLGTGELARTDLCHGWRVRDIVLEDPTPERLARVRPFLEGTEPATTATSARRPTAIRRSPLISRAPPHRKRSLALP